MSKLRTELRQRDADLSHVTFPLAVEQGRPVQQLDQRYHVLARRSSCKDLADRPDDVLDSLLHNWIGPIEWMSVRLNAALEDARRVAAASVRIAVQNVLDHPGRLASTLCVAGLEKL